MFLNFFGPGGAAIQCDPNFTYTRLLGHADDVWTQLNPNEEFVLVNSIYPDDLKDARRRNLVVRNELEDTYPGYAYRDTVITKFGSSSIHLDHLPVQNQSGHMMIFADPLVGALDIESNLDPLTPNPFTIECWFNINGAQYTDWTEFFKFPTKVDYNGYLPYFNVSLYDSITDNPNVRNAALINFWDSSLNDTTYTATGLNIPFNTWHHLALVKHGLRDFSLFLNGVRVISHVQSPATKPGPFYYKVLHFTGGSYYNGTQYMPYLRGNMDEMRVSIIARYDADFTVPTRAFPDIQCVETTSCDPGWDGTYMLVHFDEPFVENQFVTHVKNELFNGINNTWFNAGNGLYLTYPNLIESDATVTRFGGSSMRIHTNPEPITPSNVFNVHNSIATVSDAWDIGDRMDFTKAPQFTLEYWFRLGPASEQRRSFTPLIAYKYINDYNDPAGCWFISAGHSGGTDPTNYDRIYFSVWDTNGVGTQWYADITALVHEQWYHLALVKKAAFDFNIYLNGVSKLHKVPTDNWPATMRVKGGQQAGPFIGCGYNQLGVIAQAYLRGWVDELRMTGWARYLHDFIPSEEPFAAYGCECSLNFDKVVYYLHGEGLDNGTTFTDSSIFSHEITRWGTTPPVTSTAYKQFGTSSMYFAGDGAINGTGGYLELSNYEQGYVYYPYQSAAFRKNDFTVEFWIRIPVNSQPTTQYIILDGRPQGTEGPYLTVYMDSSYQFNLYVNGAVRITSNWISDQTWYHVAVVRISGVTTLYVGGFERGSWVDTTDYQQSRFRMGASSYHATLSYGLKAYVDDLMILNGYGMYSKLYYPRIAPLADSICPASYVYDEYMTALAIDYRWRMSSGFALGAAEANTGTGGTMALTPTYQHTAQYYTAAKSLVTGTVDAKSMQCPVAEGNPPTYNNPFAATAPVQISVSTPFSMGFWIIPAPNTQMQLFGSNCGSSGNYAGMWLFTYGGVGSGNLYLQFGDNINAAAGNRRSYTSATSPLQYDAPNFVVVTVVPSTNPDNIVFNVYVNGTLITMNYSSGDATTLAWPASNIAFGTGFHVNNEFHFMGVMDDCFCHFGILTQQQIQNLYLRGSGNY